MEVQERNKLRDYQKQDVQLILNKKHVGLFNEMRTGKTCTAISAANEVQGTVLVLCPACLVPNWESEIKIWATQPDKFTVVSYEFIRKDYDTVMKYKRKAFKMIIIDEAHKIKNRQSKTRLAVNKLRAEYQVALTGTPSPNEPWEVWTILNWLDRARFSSYYTFLYEYFVVTSNPWCKNIPVRFKPGAEQRLSEILNEFCTNRKLKDVANWETDTDILDIDLEPTPTQLKIIKSITENFEYGDLVTKNIVENIQRIRQICLSPKLLDFRGTSPKLKWIKDFLKSYKGSSIVIFSNSTKFITTELAEVVPDYIVGDTKDSERLRMVNDFQAGKLKVLAMNFAVGKEGWTLDQADYLVMTDVYPPASDYTQAKMRIVATKPERVKPKEIIRLRLKETYDDILYNLVDNNCETTDVINSFKQYIRRD